VNPITERRIGVILRCWISNYNRGSPYSSTEPGLPDPPADRVIASNGRQRLTGHYVVATSILGGRHHEYGIVAAG
jgi:hypothetical protein